MVRAVVGRVHVRAEVVGVFGMSAHTLGPWFSRFVSEKSWHVGVYDSTGAEVALVKVKSALSGARRDADARLIAAAPELLEASIEFLAARDDAALMLRLGAADKALRAAIAKATRATP